jgi:hypothetical protein
MECRPPNSNGNLCSTISRGPVLARVLFSQSLQTRNESRQGLGLHAGRISPHCSRHVRQRTAESMLTYIQPILDIHKKSGSLQTRPMTHAQFDKIIRVGISIAVFKHEHYVFGPAQKPGQLLIQDQTSWNVDCACRLRRGTSFSHLTSADGFSTWPTASWSLGHTCSMTGCISLPNMPPSDCFALSPRPGLPTKKHAVMGLICNQHKSVCTNGVDAYYVKIWSTR